MNIPLLSVVIVNWNSGQQLRDCLQSIVEAISYASFEVEVVVIDNHSTDHSMLRLETIYENMKIIRNNKNFGFAAACNQGASKCSGEYILFLNPDTLLHHNALAVPIDFMTRPENKKIAICGIKLLDSLGKPSTSAAHFPTLLSIAREVFGLSKLAPNLFPSHLLTAVDMPNSCVVDQVIGAYFMIRRDVFNACNGFDEKFFVYFEEVDLSKRVYEAGYLSYYLANVSSFHKGGGCSNQIKGTRLFYSLRSRLLYAAKHFTFLQQVIVILLVGIEFLLRLTKALLKGSLADMKNTIDAYALLIKSIRR